MIKIITKPIKTEFQVPECLSLDEVKEHLNRTDSDDDSKIELLIPRCRLLVENYCNISIMQKRIELVALFIGSSELPYAPVIGIEFVGNNESTIGSGIPTYTTQESGWSIEGDTFTQGGVNSWWPDDHFARFGYSFCKKTKVIYTVGMSEVPEDLKLGILNEIAYRYRNLGDEVIQLKNTLSIESKQIVEPYMILWP